MSFVGRFVIFQSVPYRSFHCVLCTACVLLQDSNQFRAICTQPFVLCREYRVHIQPVLSLFGALSECPLSELSLYICVYCVLHVFYGRTVISSMLFAWTPTHLSAISMTLQRGSFKLSQDTMKYKGK